MVARPQRRLAALLVAASLALIGFMTLRPTPPQPATDLFCIFCGSLGGVDFVLNVILFVPLGVGLRWTLGRWRAAVILGVVTTVIIEALQWRLISGRDASLGDLVSNTLGTMLGAWIASEVFHWLKAEGRVAHRYAATWGILAVIVILVSSELLQPVVPRNPQWVQWTPVRLSTERFQGQLTAVRVKSRTIRGVELLGATEAFDTLARSLSVRAEMRSPGGPSRRLAIIVRIASGDEEGFFLAQSDDAAVFRTLMAATRVKLRPILIGLDGAFPNATTNANVGEVIIEGHSDPRTIALRRYPDGMEGASVRRTVGLAWALFLPRDVALNDRWWPANALWLAALILPASLFSLRSLKPAAQQASKLAAWPVVLVMTTLLAIPATGLSPLRIGEWAGVFAGIAIGWVLERWTGVSRAPDLKAHARSASIRS